MLKISNVLITGGAGFIGSEVIDQLIDCAELIVVMDIDEERTKKLNFKNVISLNTDCINSDKVLEVINKFDITSVIHLAANSDISNGSINGSLDFKNTLQTTIAISEVLPFTNVQRVLFSSSSAIYGNTNCPISNSYDSHRQPISSYGWGKLASEYVLELTCTKLAIDLSVLRFPNVVGPNPTHGILYDLKNKLKKNPKDLEIMGDGNQTKPYMHVVDLVRVLVKVFGECSGINKYNIGPTDTISVKEIVDIVLKITSLNPEVQFGKTPEGWPGDVPSYKFQDSLPECAKDLKIRNSYESVFDAFLEYWTK